VTAKTKAGKKTGGKKTSAERRALIMWALLACENAGAFQNELKPEPLKADRETLDEAGSPAGGQWAGTAYRWRRSRKTQGRRW